MLVINYSLIEGLLCLYGVTIVFYFFIKKHTINKKYNLKKILFAFVGIFFFGEYTTVFGSNISNCNG